MTHVEARFIWKSWALLRPQDRLTACEVEPNARKQLVAALRRDSQARVVDLDGWMALPAFVPPALFSSSRNGYANLFASEMALVLVAALLLTAYAARSLDRGRASLYLHVERACRKSTRSPDPESRLRVRCPTPTPRHPAA